MFNPPVKKRDYSITLFTDSTDSWIIPWVEQIRKSIAPFHQTTICNKKEDIQKGDFNFLLGCTKILEKKYLDLNKHNLVIHESDLPKGKGWSPLSWQILEGKNTIPVVLFEAGEALDAGQIYLKDTIVFKGDELLPEIKKKQGEKTLDLVLNFLNTWPDLKPFSQKGNETIYTRRTVKDDELDIHKPLATQFNHLRIVDNEKYPAWFEINGKQYKIKIYS